MGLFSMASLLLSCLVWCLFRLHEGINGVEMHLSTLSLIVLIVLCNFHSNMQILSTLARYVTSSASRF